MQRITGLLAATFALTTVAFGQTPAPPPPSPAAQTAPQPATAAKPPQTPAKQPSASNTTLVNVVVQDKDGRPVRGLKQSNFRLTEDAIPQTITRFEEHSTSTPEPPLPAIAPLPPGMFTDFTPIPANGTLNILIVDSLNTPLKDQRSMYSQLQDFVNHADPGAHIAIFGLANHLVLLQGFDSDPAALKTVVDHQLIPRTASLLNHAGARSTETQRPTDGSTGSDPGTDQIAANIEAFRHQISSIEAQLRPQLTLDAFNTLGHYLASLPGRKNILWLSGSFPLRLSSGTATKDSSDLANADQDELRETSSLLTTAQASIYPLDARLLLARPAHSSAAKPAKFSAEESKFASSESVEHARMTSLAAAAGGKPFFNINNLSEAVNQAIAFGSNFYTLAFTPTIHNADGEYHEIAVDITSQPQPSGLQLSYNHGFYAQSALEPQQAPAAQSSATSANTIPAPGAAYARAAMSRAAPAPGSVLFKVRVLPSAAVTETKIAPGNTPDPSISATGPFRNFNVDYISLLNQLTLQLQPNGMRTGAVEFLVYVFDTDGRLLNAVGKQVTLNLPPVTYQRVEHSAMEFHLEISAPTSQDTFLRIGMRDVPTNKFGVVELPTASVSHLNPLELKAAPPSKSVPNPGSATPPASSTQKPPASAPSTPLAPATAPNAVPPS